MNIIRGIIGSISLFSILIMHNANAEVISNIDPAGLLKCQKAVHFLVLASESNESLQKYTKSEQMFYFWTAYIYSRKKDKPSEEFNELSKKITREFGGEIGITPVNIETPYLDRLRENLANTEVIKKAIKYRDSCDNITKIIKSQSYKIYEAAINSANTGTMPNGPVLKSEKLEFKLAQMRLQPQDPSGVGNYPAKVKRLYDILTVKGLSECIAAYSVRSAQLVQNSKIDTNSPENRSNNIYMKIMGDVRNYYLQIDNRGQNFLDNLVKSSNRQISGGGDASYQAVYDDCTNISNETMLGL